MNDWTKTFKEKNFPTIRKLYAAHGLADRVDCQYSDSPHDYNKAMREQTYGWMERWVRGRADAGPEIEPETKTFPVETLVKLAAAVPEDKGFAEIGRIYRARRGYKAPAIESRRDWEEYRGRMIAALKELLGVGTALPRRASAITSGPKSEGDLLVERVGYPSEGGIVVPAVVLRPKDAPGRLPVLVLLGPAGKESLLAEAGRDSPRERARRGALVVLPDVRPFGELFSTGTRDAAAQRLAWERNGIVWGRPVAGMGSTDLAGVLDGLAARPDADLGHVSVIALKSGDAAIVALFAAALDPRIAAVHADLAGGCFANRKLSLVSGVLQHGDVLQWAALVAPRRIYLHNVPPEAAHVAWLANVLTAAGSKGWHRIEPLVFERFEKAAMGKIEGGVRLVEDVVGYGGLTVPNRYSASFDGRPGTSINHGTAKKITSPDFTVEAFVKLAGRPNYEVIAADWNEAGNQRAWALVVLPGGALRLDVSPDGQFYADNVLVTARRRIEPGRWYHVAAVSRGSTSRLYVNGREVASRVRARPGIFAKGSGNLRIGSADRYATEGPRPLAGWLDEVRITPAALAPAEFLKTKEPMPEVAPSPVPEKFLMPFAAKSREEAVRWQAAARARLFELVEKQRPRLSTRDVPIDLKLGEAQDKGPYALHRVSFQGNNKTLARYAGLLAVPKGKGPFPAMLAIHGHGGSAEAVFDRKGIYKGMADRFARGGYVVLAPSFPHQPYAAMMLWDLMRAVDILASRPDVDPERIGVAGLSMGGEWTMWVAACDTRLKVAVVSGWMCTTEGVFSVPNCECWELPGLVELMDICEVHLLIAPRPVVFESAAHDGCFPIRYTREGFARIQAGYKVFGAEGEVVQDVWPAGHEWHGPVAYPAVDRVLGGRAAKATW